MKRLLINGSPRGKSGNTAVILSWIGEAISESNTPFQTVELARHDDLQAHIEMFLEADEVVLAMPLYTDSMPAIVKRFIDSLASLPSDLYGSKIAGKRVAFIVQSGFPESKQSETLGTYLERLCRRMGWVHGGTILRGGMEGTRLMPAQALEKIRILFVSATRGLIHDGVFTPDSVAALAKPYVLPRIRRVLFALASHTGITNMYWIIMLNKHHAFSRRFDAPYGASYKGRS